MTLTVPANNPNNPPSVMQTPFHLHMYQSEHFKVLKGSCTFYLGLDKAPFKSISADTNQKQIVNIPVKRYHRFENASATRELVMDVQLNEEDYEMEEKFFRNFIGYLDDCGKSKMAPSIFQLMVFLRAAGIPLALPFPNETLGVGVSYLFMQVMATWGSWVLGYQENYPEYYDSGKSR